MIMMLNDFLHVIGMGTRILLLGNFDVQNQQIKDYFPEVKSNIGYAGKIHGLYQETYRGFTLKEEFKNLEDLEVASVFLTKGLNNEPYLAIYVQNGRIPGFKGYSEH